MKTAMVAAMLTLIGGSASAAERAAKIPDQECKTLADVKAKTAKLIDALSAVATAEGRKMPDAHLPDSYEKISPSRFHFLEGIYTMNPKTPPGLPPADGALLATAKGVQGGIIFWTRGDLVCGSPMPVPKSLIDLMASGKIKDAPGEAKDEMSL